MTDASADAGIGSHRTWRWQLRDRAVIVGTLAVIPFYLLGAVNAVASPVPYGVRTTLREAVVVAVRGLADPWIILAALPPAGVAVAVAAAFVWSRSHGPRLALALTAFVLTLPMGAIGIFFGLPMAATEILLGRLDGETLHEGLIAYAAFGMWMMLWGAAALLEALLPTPAPAPPGFPVEGPTNAPG